MMAQPSYNHVPAGRLTACCNLHPTAPADEGRFRRRPNVREHQYRSMMRRCSHLRSLSLRVQVLHPNARSNGRRLGPCVKTGH